MKMQLPLLIPEQFENGSWRTEILPKYHRAWAQQQLSRRICLFWGHHSSAKWVDKSCLSQWYPSDFVYIAVPSNG